MICPLAAKTGEIASVFGPQERLSPVIWSGTGPAVSRDMLATVNSGMLFGITARPIEVEVDLTRGLPGFDVVGLAETAVRESRLRVRAALEVNGYRLPNRRLLVNLAPADLKKGGSALDLAIAIAVLAATGSCAPNQLTDTLLLGELSLGGELRSARGTLAQLRGAEERGLRAAIVPFPNREEASLARGIKVYVARTLAEVVDFLNGTAELSRPPAAVPVALNTEEDLSDVRGHGLAVRALTIAAAGGHHLLMLGPPGSGKTMLARRLPGLLPPLTEQQRLDVATIRGASGFEFRRERGRPFRAPHHSASAASLTGGGDPVKPGETTLAHHGVLFLDELPEFRRDAIESLRTSMSTGQVVVSRVNGHVTLPANPQVIAAMNPCPCGFMGDHKRACRCSPSRVRSYFDRVSGPILDRFDLHIRVPRLSPARARRTARSPSTSHAREEIAEAVSRRRSRAGRPMRSTDLAIALLEDEAESRAMSMRAFDKCLRVAETISDLEGKSSIGEQQVSEAIQYRQLDRDEDYL